MDDDFFPLFIALNRGDRHNLSGNDKHDFQTSIEHMLLALRKEAIVTVSVCLQELGGWKIKTVLKNLLYPLYMYLSSSDLVPMTFVLCIPDIQNYLEAVNITTTYLPSKQTDQTVAGRSSLRVHLVKGCLSDQQADVLVSTTNEFLDLKATAISAIIYAKAGPEIQESCHQYLKGKKSVPPWTFVVTDGFKLPCQHVIHGVPGVWKKTDSIKSLFLPGTHIASRKQDLTFDANCLQWRQFASNVKPVSKKNKKTLTSLLSAELAQRVVKIRSNRYVSEERTKTHLQDFILRCLMKISELGMASVAFPAIGTGNLGYPSKEVAVVVFEAIRYFEMKVLHPCLSDVTIVIHGKDEPIFRDFQDVEKAEKDNNTPWLEVEGVTIQVRKADVRRIKADSVIYFWEMNSFQAAQVNSSPFLSILGDQVKTLFTKKRSQMGSQTFETPGGDLNASNIVHVPYFDDSTKVTSAFRDAIVFACAQGAEVCAVFFNHTHPMLKFANDVPNAMINAIKALKAKALKSVLIVVEDELYRSIHEQFEQCIRKLQEEEKNRETSYECVDYMVGFPTHKETYNKVLKIVGLKDDVEKATAHIKSKLAEVEEFDIKHAEQRVQQAMQSPSVQEISREEREYDYKIIVKEGAEGAREQQQQLEAGKPVKYMHTTESKKRQDYVKEIKSFESEDGNRIQFHRESTKWNPSLLIPESDEMRCIEVELHDVKENETHKSLHSDMIRPPFPVAPPVLLYPYENRRKALLFCRNSDDADQLEQFTQTSKDRNYVYKKVKPQCLQKCQITLPYAYLRNLTHTNSNKICDKVGELGIVEKTGTEDELELIVTAFSLKQLVQIKSLLQDLDDSPMRSKTPDSEFGPVEKIQDVSETTWKVAQFNFLKELADLKQEKVSIYFNEGCVFIDSIHNTNDLNLTDFINGINELKTQQTEEIKPTKSESYDDFNKWCYEIECKLGRKCCFFHEESGVFVAFGKTYDDILTVKHQLGIKQGTVKQTGRRRNRNFEKEGISYESQTDSGLHSLPPLTATADSFCPPKHFDLSSDAREVRSFTTAEGIKVYVYMANILKLPVDCIVNAANAALQHGGGVAQVIENAAGSRLTMEGNNHVSIYGKVPVGTACSTTAGDLPYDCVIHAVGPRWHDFIPHTLQNVKQCESLLQNAVLSSFKEAEKKHLKRIALPAISSAIFAVPEEMCAVQYARAIQRYSQGSASNSQTLTEIHFIDKNPSIVRLIQKTFQTTFDEGKETDYDIKRYVTDNLAAKSGYSNFQERHTSGTSYHSQGKQTEMPVIFENQEYCEIHAGNESHVHIYVGNILEAHKKHAEAIVCSDDAMGRGKGGLARALIDKARNFDYGKTEKRRAFRERKKTGQIAISSGQGTGFQHVLHAILWGSGESEGHLEEQKEIVFKAYTNIFFEACRQHLRSVALPILGTGTYKSISLDESAEAFIRSYLEFCIKKKTAKLTIYLVCREVADKTTVVQIFRQTLQKDRSEPSTKEIMDYSKQNKEDSEGTGGSSETCAICMEDISKTKILSCGHVFCEECIESYHKYKKVCPTCGKTCGVIIGDQPEGKISVYFNNFSHCAGYEKYGRIEITYSFCDGKQGKDHPEPGKFYKGITRTGYLPDNKEGREIQEMLRIAFDRKLVFTIGHSRTTGKEGVITWNDIHHKTNPVPYANFGYPDPGYFARVKDELAAKGVTADDIPLLSGKQSTRGRKY